MSDYRDEIDTIMDNYDFDRVHQVMTALNWTWHVRGGNSDDYYQPEVSDIRRYARDQMRKTVEEMISRGLDEWGIECGGFRTQCERDTETGKIYIRLDFVVETWNNWD